MARKANAMTASTLRVHTPDLFLTLNSRLRVAAAETQREAGWRGLPSPADGDALAQRQSSRRPGRRPSSQPCLVHSGAAMCCDGLHAAGQKVIPELAAAFIYWIMSGLEIS